jgi:hypothetical protein
MEEIAAMNFFAWLREGVRQAVLMGVSDAVEDIGTHADGNDFRQRLGDSLRSGGAALAGSRSGGGSQRKKLGRTLEQIQAAAEKAA